ncbi:lantibiotic dehydratase [Chryseobacterium rhizosphaerae]|uniref:lantibiotic dehydratase n=1 Tax=Chryseobacterium rhizosphaerae TaxID=395937 RepID=UPI0035B50F9E
MCSDPIFQEAIYWVLPDLYDEINKWLRSEKQFSPENNQKLKHTILKYYSRMSTRCTPFGLFAGLRLGKLDKNVLLIYFLSLNRSKELY